MRITYLGPSAGVTLPQLNRVVVERGKTIEVDDEFGARLVEQAYWEAEPGELAEWVGDDQDRARRMLVAERDGERRHPDLIEHLEQIVASRPADDRSPAPDVDPDAVPAGTGDEVLAWVGEDADKAKRALEVEQSGKKRAGLMAQLERLSTKEND